MASQLPLDPTAMWRDAVAQWEKGVNDFASQTMGSSDFAKNMHGAMGTSLAVQKSFGELMSRYLTALNLPSRDEVAALGERLSGIESRLVRIASLLEKVAGPVEGGGAATAVPRTKRPPPRVEAAEPEPEPAAKAPARKKPAAGGKRKS